MKKMMMVTLPELDLHDELVVPREGETQLLIIIVRTTVHCQGIKWSKLVGFNGWVAHFIVTLIPYLMLLICHI